MECKTCKWFDPTFDGLGDPEFVDPEAPDGDGAYGLCEWPAENLPYSLRYANRERMGVYSNQGAGCPAHEPKPA